MITVNGKEYGLFLSVDAMMQIAKLCPGENLERLNDVLYSDNFSESITATIGFVCALSAGHEARTAFLDAGYEPEPLTPEKLSNIALPELWAARQAGIEAFNAGLKVTVEAETPKKKEGQ